MKVNQNISAVISNAQLHRTEDKLTASIQRLSSGYKLNKAKDNPAGMAISNKMRAQINALDQSSSNAADGTSVLQTADGGLNEIHAMLQRMRELSVQAATDTMTPDDKQACQDEVEKLQDEVDRIARDTEFNGKRILDGSQDYRMFPSVKGDLAGTYIRNFQTSDEVRPENYALKITQVAKQATYTTGAIPAGTDSEIKINGVKIDIKATDSQSDIYTKLKEKGELAGVKVEETAPGSNTYKLTTFDYGTKAKIEYMKDGTSNADANGIFPGGKDTEIQFLVKEQDQKIDQTGNPVVDDAGNPVLYEEGFAGTATYLSDGKKVTIQDLNGFKMIFEVDPEQDMENVLGNVDPADPDTALLVDLEMTDLGSMTLQVGAHENQIVDVRIPAANCEALFIDEINLTRNGKADQAIADLDDAIAQVNEIRSRIGAYQNRLDYAVKSLDTTVENMESAISRIMDTDMAEEMTTYSNMNVLDQAAISVLTQANDMPQQILQLLQ